MKRWCLFVMLALAPTYLLATTTTITDPYRVEVSATSRSNESRDQLVKGALATVLIRVSGNSGVTSIPLVRDALTKANDYLTRFAFTEPTRGQLSLEMQFDKQRINRLLGTTGQTVVTVTAPKPVIVAWILMKDPTGGQIISDDNQEAFVAHLKQSALRRGLSLVLPLADLDDLNVIKPKDLIDNDMTHIQLASKRYNGSAILVGVLEQSAAMWQAQWTLNFQNEKSQWTQKKRSIEEVCDAGVNTIGDALSARLISTKRSEVKALVSVRIDNVHTLTEYAKLTDYLSKIPSVSKVDLSAVTDDSVEFQMALGNSVEVLQRTLAMNQDLVEEVLPNSTANTLLTYRLRA